MDTDPSVELANLEASNAKRLAALMDGTATGQKVSLPKGFFEQMSTAIYLGHIARALDVEQAARMDVAENVELVLTQAEVDSLPSALPAKKNPSHLRAMPRNGT